MHVYLELMLYILTMAEVGHLAEYYKYFGIFFIIKVDNFKRKFLVPLCYNNLQV